MLLTPQKAKEFLLGSGMYWSAKDLATQLQTSPQEVNEVCKGLGKAGAIAHYYIEFKMVVDGKDIDAKKYFYARWNVKVPSSFHLFNTNFANMAKDSGAQIEGSQPPGAYAPSSIKQMFEEQKKLEGSETGKVVVDQAFKAKWTGTYKDSLAYNSIPVNKKGKTPAEHLLAFFHRYPGCAFTLKFLAIYWDASPGHIACAILERTEGKVHIWKHKGHKVASVAYGPSAPAVKIIDAPKASKEMLIPEMNAIIATLEKPLNVAAGYKILHEATPIEMLKPKLGSILKADPLMKVGFEVEYVKKPKAPIAAIHKGEPTIHGTDATKVWNLRPLSLVQECADLYILIDLSLDFPDVKELMEKKLDFLADQFSRYLDMAIGGEIRDGWSHCTNLDYLLNVRKLKILKYLQTGFMPHGSHQRAEAQSAWKSVRDELGMQALEEAYVFFRGGGWGGSYGGPKWATAVKTLMGYLNGEYSKMTFVDTVWAMQHNCNLILNKAWDIQGLAEVLQYKQDGMMVDLAPLASPEIATLWKEKRQ